jgi:hypothetical protein
MEAAMRAIPARSALLLLMLVSFTAPAHAAWPAGGTLVSSPGSVNGVRNARIVDMASGDLCVLGVGSGGNSNTYMIQRVSRDGVIAPGWPTDGVALESVIKGAPLRQQSIFVDDASRTWHAWAWGSSFLQSIATDATPTPTGAAFNLGSSGGIITHAAQAPSGDAFVTWGSARLKRLTPAGAAAAGWTSTGVGLPGTAYDDNALLADGSGGVVVFMRSISSGLTPVATRIDGNGHVHAGWPGIGLGLSTVATASSDLGSDSQLLPAGPDHALAIWSLDAGSGTRRLMMQRFALDGTLDPAWPEDGVEVVAPDTLIACRAIADGSGGAYVVRQSHGRPVATHVAAAGTTLATDVEVVDEGAQYVPTLVGGGAIGPDDMIADVTPDGGLLVGWNDTRLAPAVSFRLRWLTPSLAPAASKPDTGLVIFPGSPHVYAGSMVALHADGADGAFIAWGDYHDIGFNQIQGDLWMTHVQAPVLGVGAPAARALALSAPRPNPARGTVVLDVTLPNDSPARIELLDVAGRVMQARVVQGAGVRKVTFAELGSLAPGLYFARVSHPHGSATSRVVITR